ncbi:MAG: urea carboxylase [Actinomycetota bacterium]
MARLFTRVLVANRGEIACRIIDTLDRLGIESVAVYSDADRQAPHVRNATAGRRIGPAPAADSYLRGDRIIDAALDAGAVAIHPGYGLLSESAEFAAACEAAGLTFIGPTPDHLEHFGRKHTARQLARDADVPLVPGSEPLVDVDHALAMATGIGYPVMLKASAGGGGIGMRRCDDAQHLAEAFEAVQRLAANNFGDATLFVERMVAQARHIEVQVVGDGRGAVIDLGERDCSAQRRHQKVIEETPAPAISERLRERLCDDARRLAASVAYRSVGTVEFIVDADTVNRDDGGDAWFLEMNTRLQVEHGVTEVVHGVDLVEWMVRLAADEPLDTLPSEVVPPRHAIEARIYAEDPLDGFAPSAGLVTELCVPPDVRFDGWVDQGTEITPFYDPLIGKLIVHASTRAEAIGRLRRALDDLRIGGVATNRSFLGAVASRPDFVDGSLTTNALDDASHAAHEVKVIEGGLFTTVQDCPGRVGHWDVGVPPSGPMDDRSHRLANELLGNDPGAPALEVTMVGPTLEFRNDATFVLGGADFDATLDGRPVPLWTVVAAPAGSHLALATAAGPGLRGVIAVDGGFDVPAHLGSASTFVLGGFGGHSGRVLRPGDVLAVSPGSGKAVVGDRLDPADAPVLGTTWTVGVLPGPHAEPDFFTTADIEELYSAEWTVHFNSDRTGVRLVGPTPSWARPDGGEAGLHPSNIHDNAYTVGSVDFTGDMPIVLGRDGPSLGGFVCPATVAHDEFWKIGQARPGDAIRFVPHGELQPGSAERRAVTFDPVLARVDETLDHPGVTVRRAGDRAVLVEYGENVLDLLLRLRVGLLMNALGQRQLSGISELVPGVRSLQVGFDPERLAIADVVEAVLDLDARLGDLGDVEIPSRIVRLPLAWDDPTAQTAIDRYHQSVRPDAPWWPSNIEFIRRINGLDSIDDVKRILFEARYLVLGLGDVYLGAPVATPIDPRHRLVTTKYNPARTWTAENAVGIGGSYLCIYGMEGPGGYQLVGRTVPVWDRWGHRRSHDLVDGDVEQPWLLRFFDQIQWYPVEPDELLELRADLEIGRHQLDIELTRFSVREYLDMLSSEAESIASFTATRDGAFAAERERWAAAGIDVASTIEASTDAADVAPVPEGMAAAVSSVSGVIWRLPVKVGDTVAHDDVVAVIEAMKMETNVVAGVSGTVAEVRSETGAVIGAGDVLVIVEPEAV